MMVRAFTYIAMHGPDGLRKIAEYAVLNANYLLARLKDTYHLPYDRICMHEFVFEGQWGDAPDVHALDIAKRLMDYDFHPPTNYFPLIVHEALMIEPTETESKETLDAFADALLKIAEEAHTTPRAAERSAAQYPGQPAGRSQSRPRTGPVLLAARQICKITSAVKNGGSGIASAKRPFFGKFTGCFIVKN